MMWGWCLHMEVPGEQEVPGGSPDVAKVLPGGQVARNGVDGTPGNEPPAAEHPSPCLDPLDSLSGTFWKVTIGLGCAKGSQGLVWVLAHLRANGTLVWQQESRPSPRKGELKVTVSTSPGLAFLLRGSSSSQGLQVLRSGYFSFFLF